MNPRTQEIIDAAMTLPETERLLVVGRLLESLPPETEPFTEEELLAELNRRSEEVRNGTAGLVPWSEVQKL
jgi:putative addiction module component (TIGR02574 family)